MATAPPPPPSLPPLPAGRRLASAVRRFPPGCGRQQGNAAQPPRRPAPVPSAANNPPPSNPYARAPTKPPSPPRPPGTAGHDRGGADGPMAGARAPAAAEVVTRRLSAVRRYPPGCGRVLAAPKPEAPVAVVCDEDAGAIDLLAAVCDVEAEALAADRRAGGSDGEGKGGGDGVGAPAGCGSPAPPWDMAEVALVPWAQHGQRSQQRRKSFEGGL